MGKGNTHITFTAKLFEAFEEYNMKKIEEIRIRDPFILTDTKNKCYYMYGTTCFLGGYNVGNSFSVYKSYDLINFEDGKIVFEPQNFWADKEFWAAEVHYFNGKYYMFASFKSDSMRRGSQILVSEFPDGQFVPTTEFAITPPEWECLDGTFLVENDVPYIIFSKEWVQTENGEIYAMPLNQTLTKAIGTPKLLFRAGDNAKVTGFKSGSFQQANVTDGPFLLKVDNCLIMIWSSFCGENNYSVIQASADHLFGEWKHSSNLLFDGNGGHGMIFKDLEENLKLSIHQPNTVELERARFFDIVIKNRELFLKQMSISHDFVKADIK